MAKEMRVIAGTARGTKLQGPFDKRTRPMIDRVKESLFDILETQNRIEDTEAWDLFAGSGSLGIEALSRGASFCRFVEQDPQIFRILRTNIEKARFESRSEAFCHDAMQVSKQKKLAEFGLCFFDPPYIHFDNPVQRRKAVEYLAELAKHRAKPGAVIVLHYRKGAMAGMPIPFPLHAVEQRTYGTTQLTFLEVLPLEERDDPTRQREVEEPDEGERHAD